jgi:cytochrome c
MRPLPVRPWRGTAFARAVAVLGFTLLASGCNPSPQSNASGRGAVRAPDAHPRRFDIGRAATAEEIALVDLDVNPRGEGLPAGQGTAREGAAVYASKCASCHGMKGEGLPPNNPKLIGREPADFAFASDPKAVKTVGNYWPYATTLFDYTRRAMPQNAIGSLTPNETYAVIAWILAENRIIAPTDVLDARTLPEVKMPARDRFVRDDRTGGAGFR